ncbi:alpha-phosphoglucomutase [Melghirimyces profundicolus]|uniref:Phosphoglucomutase n=1 Tax=Melghirimyces profundicolus TaxID=1242148 RepID=A0A2T6B2S2_9BACL|nr:phospho-sugar mutase [Melghirimyces profundicolus]PTX50354.1 alpha-phosphoglucomutase [Melghirimyces profundicolus]
MNTTCQRLYQRWMKFPGLDEDLKQSLRSLDPAGIEEAFYRYLEFGTAGMRGLIGAGTNRMNRYTVRRTTEGLARHLEGRGEAVKQRGVVIAYDSRRKSPEFAEEAAGVLAFHGIRVHLFPSLRPTPMLSFAVRHLQAAAGIMITASHNPAPYNGYKVYGEDGAQIPPHQLKAILTEMEGIQDELTLPVLSLDEGREAGWIRILDPKVDRAYTERLHTLSLRGKKKTNGDLSIVFTPLHGTGNLPVRRILEELGYTGVQTVPEQEQPDPEFPTVTAPNPEDPQALDLALKQARDQSADLVIGTDPDADRLGLLARNRTGDYVAFNGNQIGALLLQYLLEKRKERGTLPENGVILKSLVTSELGRSIAGGFGVSTEDVLTGFKYIAEKIKEYEESGRHTFLFGYEESYGYLPGDFVRDKDAVQTALLCCEMAAHYKDKGLTLDEVLHGIFEEHGWYREALFSFTFEGKAGLEKMASIMERFRTRPPGVIGGLSVRELKDYQQGIDGLPAANVLKYRLEGGSWIAIRPSGTEPKIKFYFSVVAPSEEEARTRLDRLQRVVRGMLED